MNNNEANKNFYVLESTLYPGVYYIDNWKGFTPAVSRAKRYPSPEKALEYLKKHPGWRVCKVHLDLDIQRI